MWNNFCPNWVCSPKISCLINWGKLFCFLKESFPVVSVLGDVTTMSLKNCNRQFLRSEGKGQDERNLNQMGIYKPMPSLVSQPLLFACCAAGLSYTSQGMGFVSVFLMKLSFKTERKGKETEQLQVYCSGKDTIMHEGLDPARNARGSGTVQTLCQCGSPHPWCTMHPYTAPAEQGMGSVALLSPEVKDGGPDEQEHEGWTLLLATICLQMAVSAYKYLLPCSLCGCPLLTSQPGSRKGARAACHKLSPHPNPKNPCWDCRTSLQGEVWDGHHFSWFKLVCFSAHRVSVLLEASQKALFLGQTSSHGNTGLFSLGKADQVPLKLTRQVTDKSYECLGLGRENLSTPGLVSTPFHTKDRAGFGLHMGCQWHCVYKMGALSPKRPDSHAWLPFMGETGILGWRVPVRSPKP